MREPCGLLQQRFGLHLPVRTMGEYLQRWGFTPQQPLTKAYEQNPRKVKAWLEAHRDAIAVHHLPSSSPVLNPDERLNRSLKSKLGHLPAARDERSLQRQIIGRLRSCQKQPEHVRSFFASTSTKYAA